MDVESDCAHGVVAIELFQVSNASYGGFRTLVVFEATEGVIGETSGLALLCLFQALAFAIEDELRILDEGHAMSVGKLFRSGSDEVDMGAFFENKASRLNGVTQTLDARNAASLHAAAVHEESVELNATIGGEETSPPCIERGVVFHHGHCSFDGIDGGSATRKHSEASFKSFAHAGFVCGGGVIRNGPRTAVDDQRGFMGGRSHPLMVVDRAWNKM